MPSVRIPALRHVCFVCCIWFCLGFANDYGTSCLCWELHMNMLIQNLSEIIFKYYFLEALWGECWSMSVFNPPHFFSAPSPCVLVPVLFQGFTGGWWPHCGDAYLASIRVVMLIWQG